MRRLKANCIGALAVPLLREENGKTIGNVTTTFPNSFYARTFNDELLFVTNRSLRSPVTINIDFDSNLQRLVEPREEITIRGHEIHIGQTLSIDLADVAEYGARTDHVSTKTETVRIEEGLRTIAVILRIIDTKGSVLDPDGLTYRTVAGFLHRGAYSLRVSDQDQFRKAAEDLIGLGSGFTPSGDDFLGGFLAAYNTLAPSIGRERVLMNSDLLVKKTNWVSAKLLDYMQRLILDQQISQVLGSAAAGNSDDFVLALESLLPRGHTSGIDIAAGTSLGLAIARDISLKSRQTEIFAKRLGFAS